MFYNQRDTRTDRERYLEDEIDRYREQESRRLDEMARQRQEREREWRERIEESERSADSWPEALRKQIVLLRREVTGSADETDLDAFFETSAQACETALRAWDEIVASKQAEIAALKARLEAVRDSVRLEVAARLEADGRNEYRQTAAALRESNPSAFLWW